MKTEYLRVNPGEAKIASWSGEMSALATLDLGKEFAITAFNPATKTAGLARSVNNHAIETFLRSLLSPNTYLLYPVLQVRIIGGGTDAASENKLGNILKAILNVDASRDFINIVSADVNGKPYPQSFKITLFDGNIGAIN